VSDRQVNCDEPMVHGFFEPHYYCKSLKQANCDVCVWSCSQANMRTKSQKHHSLLFQHSDLKTCRGFQQIYSQSLLGHFMGMWLMLLVLLNIH
jgi:hypothetical protein